MMSTSTSSTIDIARIHDQVMATVSLTQLPHSVTSRNLLAEFWPHSSTSLDLN